MTIAETDLYDYIAKRPLAVISTVSADRTPEAALVGVAVTRNLELIFDTTDVTRKCTNLRRNPRVAFVIGWDDERTLQYEGVADEPEGNQLEALKKVYFAAHPDGVNRQNWPGLTYFRARPLWVRFSNYYRPRSIEEMTFAQTPAPQRSKVWWNPLNRI
jgi:hypothetical protein